MIVLEEKTAPGCQQDLDQRYQPDAEVVGDEPLPAYPPNGDQQAFDVKYQIPYIEHPSARPKPRPMYTPHRSSRAWSEDDPSNPAHYTRDPHKLIAYLIPLPKPSYKDVPTADVPDRFLIYTPPPPPLTKPPEGTKEGKMQKMQRKWQEEVREAKTTQAKAASWKGIRGRATRGIDWAICRTTTSNLDFLNRLGGDGLDGKGKDKSKDKERQREETAEAVAETESGIETADHGVAQEEEPTKKTVGLTDLVLVYPSTFQESPDGMRREFVNSMLRTKSKAQRDAVLATGLIPVAFAVDMLAMLVWPFGGLVEIDSVWAYASFRGAKIANSTTKRLKSSATDDAENPSGEKDRSKSGKGKKANQLHLNFTPSARIEVLYRYLAARCHERDPLMFKSAGGLPTETEVLAAIGWAPSQMGGEKKSWKDEQWEAAEVKEDFKQLMIKGAREWHKWCKAFEKNPKKALKK